MSKHWKEQTDPDKHLDFMSTTHVGGLPIESSPEKGEWVYFVRECSFTFQFASLRQLKEVINYFSVNVHPSNKRFNDGLEHYWQLWYERLPRGLNGGTKREKICHALKRALIFFEKD